MIGNPPYIDSETMTNVMPEMRKKYTNLFQLTGNWDIYMAFFEQALKLSDNVVSFITPDKWLSKPFGEKFRKNKMIPKLNSILHCGSKIFKNATVDSIVTVFVTNSETLDVRVMQEDISIKTNISIRKSEIQEPYYIDYLFSPYARLINQIDNFTTVLSFISECENACATHDCYELQKLIYNKEKPSTEEFKLVNTGTIGKYLSKWGEKECTYLGNKYQNPVLMRKKFENESTLGKTYRTRAHKSKLIMKGLNLLDVCIDFNGEYVPGKSTLILPNNDKNVLKFLAGLLNSKLVFFYLKHKYSSSSYCGGTTFTKDMINNLPIPLATTAEQQPIIALVDKILDTKKADNNADTSALEKQINTLVYKLYALTYDEVLVIDKDFALTKAEYEEINC